MFHKLTQSSFLVLVLCIGAMAQGQREDAAALIERAQKLEPLIVESANHYGIDARVLRMMCFIESRFRVEAISPRGARGPMQFMPETAARYGLVNPHDPKAAIDAGARYLRDLLKKFGGRIALALAAYNSGEAAVESFLTGRRLVLRTGKIINARGVVTGGIPPFPETQRYVNSILRLSSSWRNSSPSIQSRRSSVASSPINDRKENKKKQRVTSSFIEVD